jgi:pyruvate/2-oxoglutarate dehydrogenase complex dihydrolipoamide dehydrogenase (E3) component
MATIVVVGWNLRARDKAYGPWQARRPRRYDRNLVVIGAGAGGLVSAAIAAGLQARVTLVEARQMGGDCLNHGCIPSKALAYHAKLAHQMRQAMHNDLIDSVPPLRFDAVMRQVRQAIANIAPRDSATRYAALGVEVLHGNAKLIDPWTVEITGADDAVHRLTTRSIILATGAIPAVPPIAGLTETCYLTSDTLWRRLEELSAPPCRLLVLGGGAIGCELAQALARLGSQVTLLEEQNHLLASYGDEEVSDWVHASLKDEGIQVLLGQKALRFEHDADCKTLVLAGKSQERRLQFDEILCATGRQPRLYGYGLEKLGLIQQDTLATGSKLQTCLPHIFVVGDVVGPWRFTHAAAQQAWHATVNALSEGLAHSHFDANLIPRVVFIDPEVAQAGLTERQALSQAVAYELIRFDLAELDRAICEGCARGFVKVLTMPGKDRILGVTIVGQHAGELLAEFCLAMQHGLGLKAVLRTVHAYPTFSEANRLAAGQWRRQNLPSHLLPWLQRMHRWRRGSGND